MPVNVPPLGELLPVPGVELGVAAAGVKAATAGAAPVAADATPKSDMVLMQFAPGTTVAGVFTQSHFRAAPVQLCQRALNLGPEMKADVNSEPVRGFVINSGNANAATGEPGIIDARQVCTTAAQLLGDQGAVLPFSTGVIGERLPVAAMQTALHDCVASMSADGWDSAVRAIMTTDTVPKAVSERVAVGTTQVTITGMTKGSGMIRPDMATMLAYLCCDAQVPTAVLQQLCREVADASFNRLTVDGDTSTNDCAMLVATGVNTDAVVKDATSPAYQQLRAGLLSVARELAQRMVRDGEGATKFVTIKVGGGTSEAQCLSVAYTIAHSPLVKTALFAGDPNWGRFCMAIGRAPVPVNPDTVCLSLDHVQVATNGLVDANYSESAASAVMAQDDFCVAVDLGMGSAACEIWTTDFSYDYVRINAEYRT